MKLSLLFEMDERLRKLERDALSGDPEAVARHNVALKRANLHNLVIVKRLDGTYGVHDSSSEFAIGSVRVIEDIPAGERSGAEGAVVWLNGSACPVCENSFVDGHYAGGNTGLYINSDNPCAMCQHLRVVAQVFEDVNTGAETRSVLPQFTWADYNDARGGQQAHDDVNDEADGYWPLPDQDDSYHDDGFEDDQYAGGY